MHSRGVMSAEKKSCGKYSVHNFRTVFFPANLRIVEFYLHKDSNRKNTATLHAIFFQQQARIFSMQNNDWDRIFLSGFFSIINPPTWYGDAYLQAPTVRNSDKSRAEWSLGDGIFFLRKGPHLKDQPPIRNQQHEIGPN